MGTNIYFDGFNLYYCAVRYTPYKWLDLLSLCTNLFPTKTIDKIKYFSAKVTAVPWDPGAPTRQDFYWRALRTIQNLEIIKGNFVSWPRYLPQFPSLNIKGGGTPDSSPALKCGAFSAVFCNYPIGTIHSLYPVKPVPASIVTLSPTA